MGRQQELPPRQRTISVEQPLLTKTDTAIRLVRPRLPPITSVTPQRPTVTAMATQREQIDQVLITMVTPTLVTLIPMATPEVHHPPQQTTSATPQLLIETETDTLKVLPLPQRTILEIVVPSSVATTPTQPSGLGNDTSLHTTNPESSSASYFRGSIVHESTHVVV